LHFFLSIDSFPTSRKPCSNLPGSAMKILRSATRRGFSVGTAGYFAVLKPQSL
jgi:hypothetical protein